MKKTPSPSKKRKRGVVLPPLKLVEAECAFCKGNGKDPFGIMSELSTCCVCGGKGTVVVGEPYVACHACSGTGVAPCSRLVCLACKGKGVITVAQLTESCPVCKGTGRYTSHLYCFLCRGAGVVSVVSAGGSVGGSREKSEG